MAVGAARDVARGKQYEVFNMILKELQHDIEGGGSCLASERLQRLDLTLRLKRKAKMSGQHKYSKGGRDLFFLISRKYSVRSTDCLA